MRESAARRRLAIVASAAVPLVLAAAALALRVGGVPATVATALLAAAIAAGIAWRAWRDVDPAWLARRLDASSPAMDDSAALLFRDTAALSDLQRLQQTRVRARLADLDADLRPAWPWPRLGAAFGIALIVLLVAALWRPQLGGVAGADRKAAQGAANATALARVRIDVTAPAYTKLPPRTENALDAKAPEGSRLQWNLRFDPEPSAAALVFHDGSRTPLRRDGDGWRGEHALTASTLYRIALEGAPPPADDRLHRLDAIADRAPEVRVLEPEKTLTLLDAQQKTWNLAFEASDDYGIAGAELQITLAQGGGENVKFTERTVALQGDPLAADDGAEHRRFRHTLDLAALGIAQGDDVIVRLLVTDNREPKPNATRSASFILRWPPEASSDAAGLDGIVQKTMPAYFRSQRQIIIDSEALLAEKPGLEAEKFLARSDAIGVDQRVLRLRYGQFLGEESETRAQHGEAREQAAAQSEHGESHDGAEEPAHGGADEHAHDAAGAPGKFGEAGDIVAEFGHVHDIAEAATLLDPETKATLKSALAEMWQAELHLRQGRPDEALPYEHRALEFIKQVQQSTRIYLARVGLELPAPDEARRLSGERKGVDDRAGSLVAATNDDVAAAALWRSLASGGAPDYAAAETWLRARQASLPDALGVLAAIDRARRDPACAECRTALRDLLWPLLPTAATASVPRAAPDAAGRVYLDALQAGTGSTP
ncbi:MAG: DUF4175 family protein [Dokdonella sp.]|nr:DUF4175 family protein [Dokdonella sp.]